MCLSTSYCVSYNSLLLSLSPFFFLHPSFHLLSLSLLFLRSLFVFSFLSFPSSCLLSLPSSFFSPFLLSAFSSFFFLLLYIFPPFFSSFPSSLFRSSFSFLASFPFSPFFLLSQGVTVRSCTSPRPPHFSRKHSSPSCGSGQK